MQLKEYLTNYNNHSELGSMQKMLNSKYNCSSNPNENPDVLTLNMRKIIITISKFIDYEKSLEMEDPNVEILFKYLFPLFFNSFQTKYFYITTICNSNSKGFIFKKDEFDFDQYIRLVIDDFGLYHSNKNTNYYVPGLMPNGDHILFISDDLKTGILGNMYKDSFTFFGNQFVEGIFKNPLYLFKNQLIC